MNKLFAKLLLGVLFVFGILQTEAQVSVTATAGTTGPTAYTTLKFAFDAINAGTHQGAIVVSITANTTEGTTPATLNSSGAGSASYTSINIRPTTDGVSVSGNPVTGFGVIQLKGADNVTIDGDNPNTGGTNRNLTVNNTTTATAIANSCIRIATVNVAAALDASNITIKNCVLNGNVTSGNLSSITSNSSSSNSSFGIYVGGNGGSTAIDALTAITSVSSQTIPASTTVNTLLIDNNQVNQCARGIVFNGSSSASSTGITISNNIVGASGTPTPTTPPFTSPATTVYSKGIWIFGTNAYSITGNTIQNIMSYILTTPIYGIEINGATGSGTMTISNNIVSGIAQNSATATNVRGITVSQAGGPYTVSGNTISNVQGVLTGISSSTTVGGIVANTTATSATITGNKVTKIYNNNTGTTSCFGINLAAGNNITVQNNFVSDVLGNMAGGGAFSTSFYTVGINVAAGTGHKIYHNSVNMSGTMFGTANSSILTAAFAISATTLTGIDVRNNIFSNTITGGTTSIAHVSMFLPSSGTSTMNLILNNNAYYTGTTSGVHGICHAGTTYTSPVTSSGVGLYTGANFVPASTAGVTNLRNYTSTLLAANTNNDNASLAFTSAAPFTSASDLHIPAATNTQLESGGASTSVTTDIDGDARPGPTGSVNGGATAPDLGADEFDGTPPSPMVYVSSTTTQTNTSSVQTNTTNQQVIGIQVVTSGTTSPLSATSFTLNTNGTSNVADITNAKLFYTGTSSTFATTTPFGSSVATPSGSFGFTSTQTLSTGTNYFWLTYDVPCGATLSNVIDAECNSITVVSSQTPTVQAPVGSRTIVAGPLSGTKTVGTGGDYATLTAAAADINTKGLGGNTILSILNNITEVGAVTINQWVECGGSGFTLTIKPAAATTPTISANSATAVIVLNGADRVTVDGSNSGATDRSLTISNTNAATPAGVSVVSLGIGLGATNNTIKNCNIITAASSSTGYGISVGGGTPGTTGADNDNVIIQNNNITVATVSIYAAGTTSVTVGGDDNLQITGNTVNSSTTLQNQGIQIGNALNGAITGNTISITTSGAFPPIGISIETGYVSSTITLNKITTVLATNTGGYGGRGITVGTGTSSSALTIANNVIYGVNGSNWNTFENSSSMGIALGFIGGSTTSTTTAGGINLYYNSVNMSGSIGAGSSTALTSALYIGSAVTALDIRNNVLVNTQVGTNAAQKNYAIYSAATIGSFTTINNNDYFVSNTFNPSSAIPGFIGSDRTNLAGIQAGFGQNGASIITNPLFQNNSDLRPAVGSPLVNAGVTGTGITTDFLAVTRSVTTPTIGAYENAVDATPPVITYTILGNTLSVANRNLTAVTITDPGSGLSAAKPRLYYKKSGDANTYVGNTSADNGWKYVESNGTTSPFDFTIDYTLLQTGAATPGDAIQYFVTAADAAAIPNVAINSGAFTAIPASVALTSAAFPITGTINQYTISIAFAGSYNIPGSYPTLTGAGGFFAAVNAGIVTGNVIVNITANLTEDGTNALNEWIESPAASNFTMTIQPDAGTVRDIVGNVTTAAMIRLNGADRVTVDGRSGGSGMFLRFRNTSTAQPVLSFLNDATSNTIRYSFVEGSNATTTTTTGGVILFGTTTGTTGNDNNTIDNCHIRDRSDLAFLGSGNVNFIAINSVGTTTTTTHFNSGIQVTNCNIFNMIGTATTIGAGNTGWTISNNSFYLGGAVNVGGALTTQTIQIASGDGYTISGNYIGGSQALAGGTPWSVTGTASGTVAHYAIRFTTGTSAAASSTVSNNTIRNFSLSQIPSSSALNFAGILVEVGQINVTGNMVGDTTGTGSITHTSTGATAFTTSIELISMRTVTGGYSVTNNNVGSTLFTGTATGGMSIIGILISSVTSSSAVTVSGNKTGSDLTANNLRVNPSASSTPGSLYGILNTSSSPAVVNITNNIVANLVSNSDNSTSSTFVRGIGHTGTSSHDISNNTIHDLKGAGSFAGLASITLPVIGIYKNAGNASGTALINDNRIYNLSATNPGNFGTVVAGIAHSIVTPGNNTAVPVEIRRNHIYGLSNASTSTTLGSTTTPVATGIYFRQPTAGSNILVANNEISLGEGVTNNTTFIGLWYGPASATVFATVNGFYNTIHIGGTVTSGALPSYAFMRGDFSLIGATSPIILRNNNFDNIRTGGSGKHYAIANYATTPSTSGWSGTASDRNNLYSSNAATIGQWGTTDQTFAAWKTTSAGDANSVSGASVFTNSAVGNLLPLTQSNCILDNAGTPITIAGSFVADVLNDITLATRSATTPDIGAYEFTGNFTTVTAGSAQTVCGTSATLGGSAVQAGGSGTWTVVAGTGTFSPNANTAGATVNGLSYGLNTFKWTVTNGSCSGNANVNITANAISTLATVATSAACSGSGAIINLTGLVAGSTTDISYNINGGSTQTAIGVIADGSGNGSFTSVAVSDANDGQALTITSMTRTDITPNCGPTTFNNPVTLSVGNTWVGTSADGNTSGNWTCGLPTSTSNIIIPASPSGGNMPVLSGDIAVAKVNIQGASTLTIGNHILTINGAISGTGTFTGSSTSELIIGGAVGTLNFTQTNASTRSIKNITFNSGATATLGDVLDVYGDIEFTPSTSNNFNVNGKNLTLKSTAAYTARIGNLTGTTLGGATNVTVERFFNLRTTGGAGTGSTGRAYRLIASTVNTTGHATKPTMKDNWMEGGMNTAIGTNVNPLANYGVQITGASGNANGFDKTQSNAASLYNASNAVTPTYTAVANTGGALNPLTGCFLYVRGDRSMDMTIPLAPGTMPTSSTTLRATGIIQTGDKSVFTNSFVGGAGTLNLVTNPYPSPINWSSVYNEGGTPNTTITDAYTYWDPNVGNRGGFVTVNTAGGTSTAEVGGSIGGNIYIQSGQAFFVQASGAAAPALTIKETHKATGDNSIVFRTASPPLESFRISMYYTETNGYRQVADGTLAIYGDYKAAVDNHDAFEINNWDENIAIARDGKHLAIESRPVIAKSDDLPIFMNNMKQRDYEFQFDPLAFTNTNLKAELVDNYLGTRTLLSVTAPTTVAFTITADAASKATDRFKVVFGAFGSAQGVDAITIKASQQNGGVQVDWTSKTETDMLRYEVEKSTYGTTFAKTNSTTALGNSTSPVNYNWFDVKPNMGTNFYRVKGIDKAGNVRYSDIVRVLFGKGEPHIVVYPSPMEGNTFKVDMYNLAKGNFQLNLYNAMGQKVYTEQWQHDGSQATKIIQIKGEIGKGAYQLQLSGDNGFKTSQIIIKN